MLSVKELDDPTDNEPTETPWVVLVISVASL